MKKYIIWYLRKCRCSDINSSPKLSLGLQKTGHASIVHLRVTVKLEGTYIYHHPSQGHEDIEVILLRYIPVLHQVLYAYCCSCWINNSLTRQKKKYLRRHPQQHTYYSALKKQSESARRWGARQTALSALPLSMPSMGIEHGFKYLEAWVTIRHPKITRILTDVLVFAMAAQHPERRPIRRSRKFLEICCRTGCKDIYWLCVLSRSRSLHFKPFYSYIHTCNMYA